MTAAELIAQAAKRLSDAGVPEPELDAKILFLEAFHMDQVHFLMNRMRPLTEEQRAQQETYEVMIDRRSARVPLQQILGSQEFMGLTFRVTPDVLIPRQDTELLVEKLLPHIQGKRVLDVCTGSGCIAISLAVLGKPEQMDAVDLSEKALIQAGKNAKRLGADVSFYRSDMLDEINGRYDVIVSNPPYIASDVVDELMPEVQEHEPRMALDGGADGLDLYRRLLAQAPERLLSGGLLAVEIGYDQREAVMELFREQGFTDVYCDRDLCGNDRVVMGRYQ